MQKKFSQESQTGNMRGANATMLDHYAQFATHVLTLTLRDNKFDDAPSVNAVEKQIGHIKATLNWHVWGKRTKRNAKAKILFIPILEGANGNKRMHLHILLGNIKSAEHVNAYLQDYIPASRHLARRHTLDEIYAIDGLNWYLTKETQHINADAIRWQSALIPAALIPKRYTLLKA
jgi:hypothetical protein